MNSQVVASYDFLNNSKLRIFVHINVSKFEKTLIFDEISSFLTKISTLPKSLIFDQDFDFWKNIGFYGL